VVWYRLLRASSILEVFQQKTCYQTSSLILNGNHKYLFSKNERISVFVSKITFNNNLFFMRFLSSYLIMQYYTCNKLILHLLISVFCLYYWPIKYQNLSSYINTKTMYVHILRKEKRQKNHWKWMTEVPILHSSCINMYTDLWQVNNKFITPCHRKLQTCDKSTTNLSHLITETRVGGRCEGRSPAVRWSMLSGRPH
jgi:hypothetical protein